MTAGAPEQTVRNHTALDSLGLTGHTCRGPPNVIRAWTNEGSELILRTLTLFMRCLLARHKPPSGAVLACGCGRPLTHHQLPRHLARNSTYRHDSLGYDD